MLNYDNYSQSLEFLFFYFQASGTKLMDEKYHWFVLTKVKKKEKLITIYFHCHHPDVKLATIKTHDISRSNARRSLESKV